MPNKNIYSELQQGNLVDALVMLQTKVSSLGDWQLQQDLEWVRDTYSTMLSYLAKGIEDPKAQSIRTDLIQQAYAINDRANRAITLKKSPFNKYCQAFTQSKAEALDIAATQIALETVGEEIKHLLANTNQRERIREHDLEAAVRQHDTLIEKLFNHIWTSGIWTKSENTLYTQLMGSEQLPADDKAIIISALTLACYELFDAQKLMLLFDSYLQNDIEVSQRSLVGLILLIIRYDNVPHVSKASICAISTRN